MKSMKDLYSNVKNKFKKNLDKNVKNYNDFALKIIILIL